MRKHRLRYLIEYEMLWEVSDDGNSGMILTQFLCNGRPIAARPWAWESEEEYAEVSRRTKQIRASIQEALCDAVLDIKLPYELFLPEEQGIEFLLPHYKKAYPRWREAQRIFKRNAQSQNWKEHVKLEYSDLPEELIARLSKNPLDLSEEHLERLEEKGGSGSPSDIAAEHAARLCGLARYQYALTTLKRLLSEKRQVTKNIDFSKPVKPKQVRYSVRRRRKENP